MLHDHTKRRRARKKDSERGLFRLLDAGASLSHRRNRGACIMNATQDTKNLQFQIDALQSRLDFYACQLQALWGVFRSLPEGEQILLRIQKDAHALYQTMELEHL